MANCYIAGIFFPSSACSHWLHLLQLTMKLFPAKISEPQHYKIYNVRG